MKFLKSFASAVSNEKFAPIALLMVGLGTTILSGIYQQMTERDQALTAEITGKKAQLVELEEVLRQRRDDWDMAQLGAEPVMDSYNKLAPDATTLRPASGS